MMKITGLTLAAGLALAAPAALAATPWLPAPGALHGSVSYVHQSAEEFFLGDEETDLPDDLELNSLVVDLFYGLRDDLMFYAQLGAAESTFDPAGENDRGVSDTRLGVAWRLLDEFASPDIRLYSVTVRGAAIVEGNYETGRIDAIGDGGSGFEFSVSGGHLPIPSLALSAELGYRTRRDDVPEDVFINLDAGWVLAPRLSLALNYQFNDSDGELDIGGPGFTPARFPQVEEDRSQLTGSVSWAASRRLSVRFFLGEVLDGRNTPKSELYGLSLGSYF